MPLCAGMVTIEIKWNLCATHRENDCDDFLLSDNPHMCVPVIMPSKSLSIYGWPQC